MKRIALVLLSLAMLSSVASLSFAGPVNINTADAETLALELTGIGPALARAIVEYREKNGRFQSPEEITRVSGIGNRVFENNRSFIMVDDAASD